MMTMLVLELICVQIAVTLPGSSGGDQSNGNASLGAAASGATLCGPLGVAYAVPADALVDLVTA